MTHSFKRRRVWIGFSEPLGIVIFDPDLQRARDPLDDRVVLWRMNPGWAQPFSKDEARAGICPLWKHLMKPPRSMTEEAARRRAREIGFSYCADRDREEQGDDYEYSAYPEDYEADRDRALLGKDLSDDQDDWSRSDEEGWFYPD